MDCKNEIYAKNWVRSTCIAKKSTLQKSQRSKVNSSDDVSKMTLSDDVS